MRGLSTYALAHIRLLAIHNRFGKWRLRTGAEDAYDLFFITLDCQHAEKVGHAAIVGLWEDQRLFDQLVHSNHPHGSK